MAFAAGTRFGVYEIAGLIGVGGMGEVYRATDTTLGREVAIKVLPQTFAANADRIARFEREAKTLASLNHTNIGQIYGLERRDGTTALVLELVEGPSLTQRIAQGPLPADEAIGIALQIANALEAAHERGIIHRDLKPANVTLRPDGSVKVLDFGIAKALEPKATMGSQLAALTTPAMTEAGLVLGTAAYMSPEQARGKSVDERADIWAFGCVLYEMLTGQPAFGGEDVTITLARVVERSADMNALPATISPDVRQAIKLCLQKDLKKRIADIRDVRLALEGAFESRGRSGAVSNTEASGSVAGKSVAVLPFADLSESGDLTWLADGLAEEILNSLGQVPELKVTARTSSFQFRNQSRDIGEIADRLGVANVLEGSVRVSGDQLRVTAQLIRAVDGFHVWSNVYGGTTSSLFEFERDVAESVAAALDVALDESRRARMFASGTQNVEAFQAYQEGWRVYDVVHSAPSDQTLWDANTHFERAMALDPRYAQAAIGRTDAFGHLLATPRAPFVRNSPYSREEALTRLHQTLDFIAANGSTATMRLGAQIFRENFSPTWYRMPRLFAQLRQQWDVNSMLFGGGVDSALWVPLVLLVAGQTDLVRALAESHVRNDPLSTHAWFRRVLVEIHARDFDSARELLAQARRNLGSSSLERLELIIARFEGDRAAAIQIFSRKPPSQVSSMHMASINGDYATAMRIADELEKQLEDPPGVDWAALLLVYYESGEAERARVLVKRIDESLAGTAIFVWLISDYGNGLYFDLNDAPNFVAKLNQARIDPASFDPVPRLSTVQLRKHLG